MRELLPKTFIFKHLQTGTTPGHRAGGGLREKEMDKSRPLHFNPPATPPPPTHTMSNWDQGFWDSSFWDSGSAPPSTKKRPMITLKTSLFRLGRDQQYTKMEAGKNGLKNHPAEYPDPEVPIATVETRLALAKAKLDLIKELEDELAAETILADAALALCRGDYDANAIFVVGIAKTDRALGHLSGYDLADEPGGPPQPLGQLLDVRVVTGDEDGELETTGKKLPYAVGYEWQWAENPAGPWNHAAVSGTRAVEIKNLPSLKKIWIRGRGIRGTDHGPWSDPACGLVP